MALIITSDDLPASVRDKVDVQDLELMVNGANAKASRIAPCLTGTGVDEPTTDQVDEAKLVLVGAIRRWVETGSGGVQTQTAGPFGQTIDTRQRTGYNFWPSEIEQIQAVCKMAGSGARRVFSVDTAPSCSTHLPWCSLMMGAAYCSCGVDIAGFPIFEDPDSL